MARKHAPLALVYDFDGTLAPGNMQEHNFIPKVGTTTREFWAEVQKTAREAQADQILVYMNLMRKKAEQAGVPFTREEFKKHGQGLKLFEGVEDWFDRITAYGRAHEVKVEHYLITSGNEEIVRGTAIASKFARIYASKYLFDENNVAKWPALAVNYTTKTQYLFRINKGALDLDPESDKLVNDYVPLNDRPVPFENMVFIGDGATDIPCFRLVKDQGGLSVAVYKPNTQGAKSKAQGLVETGRVHTLAPAVYTNGSELDETIKAYIESTAARARLRGRFAA